MIAAHRILNDRQAIIQTHDFPSLLFNRFAFVVDNKLIINAVSE